MSKYVGFRLGKVHESHVISEYYCGGCGWPVTDHDSFCSECGGALRECDASNLEAENAKLREQLERVQPTDCEGNALDIADTVSMLRSEYDGDHEWDDVVVELALTKWGGDRWIVRGSKGEAWACECTKTGYDEDTYEASDDVEPFGEPTLLEVENAKLRSQCADLVDDRERLFQVNVEKNGEVLRLVGENAKLRELATYALRHIIEFECEEPDRETLRGKPCEDCADYGSSDCPKCMPRMFSVLGIEVS